MGDVSLSAVLYTAQMNNGIISTHWTILIVQFRDNQTVRHFSTTRPSVWFCAAHTHACTKTGLHPDRAMKTWWRNGLFDCCKTQHPNTTMHRHPPAHMHSHTQTQTSTKAGLVSPWVFPTAASMKNLDRSDLIGYFEPISDPGMF